MMASLVSQHTWRLWLDLIPKRSRNVYTIFGDKKSAMQLPPELFNELPPAGVDLGGVHPALHNLTTTAQYDSWLTVGPVDAGASSGGSGGGHGLGSVGLDFKRFGRSAAAMGKQTASTEVKAKPERNTASAL